MILFDNYFYSLLIDDNILGLIYINNYLISISGCRYLGAL